MRLRLRRVDWILAISVAVIGAIGVSAVFAPNIAPHDPLRLDLFNSHVPPAWDPDGSREHLLGTDYLGRDLLSRVIHGSRTSLAVALAAVAVAGSFGTTIGLIAGFNGGSRLDTMLMGVADVQLSLPPILLAIAILTTAGNTMLNVVLVLGLIGWVQYARIVRGATLALREREFVEASLALGASSVRTLFRHILPNVAPELVVVTTTNVSAMMLAEASLSFLGLGVPPPTPAWGMMINESRAYVMVNWWSAVFPGLAIMAAVVAISLIGDRLVKN